MALALPGVGSCCVRVFWEPEDAVWLYPSWEGQAGGGRFWWPELFAPILSSPWSLTDTLLAPGHTASHSSECGAGCGP